MRPVDGLHEQRLQRRRASPLGRNRLWFHLRFILREVLELSQRFRNDGTGVRVATDPDFTLHELLQFFGQRHVHGNSLCRSQSVSMPWDLLLVDDGEPIER